MVVFSVLEMVAPDDFYFAEVGILFPLDMGVVRIAGSGRVIAVDIR